MSNKFIKITLLKNSVDLFYHNFPKLAIVIRIILLILKIHGDVSQKLPILLFLLIVFTIAFYFSLLLY